MNCGRDPTRAVTFSSPAQVGQIQRSFRRPAPTVLHLHSPATKRVLAQHRRERANVRCRKLKLANAKAGRTDTAATDHAARNEVHAEMLRLIRVSGLRPSSDLPPPLTPSRGLHP